MECVLFEVCLLNLSVCQITPLVFVVNTINQVNFGFGFKQIEWKPLACYWLPIWNLQATYFSKLSKSSINQTWSQSWSFVIWKKETKYYWPPYKASKLCWPFLLGWSFENMHDNKPNQEPVTTIQSFKTMIVTETWQGKGKKDMVDTHLTCMYFCLVLVQKPCAHVTNVQICDLSSM